MWLASAPRLAAGLLSLTCLTHTLAASTSSPYSPTADPGIYPGGNANPPDGWTTLPSVSGAKIDNTTLVVGSGSATLVHYIDESYDASKIKRAVIQIHGENRDAWNQWTYADLSANRAATGGSFDRDEVVVMAPMFFITADEGAYAFDRSLDTNRTRHRRSQPDNVQDYAGKFGTEKYLSRRGGEPQLGKRRIPPPLERISLTQAMIWKSVEWADGSPCYEPSDARGAGGFEALDAAVDFFLDTDRFPQLRNVVVAGFSLGGQLVNRYATFRSNNQDDRVLFWISSPNSFVYLQDTRPVEIEPNCSDYNEYKYGLSGTLPSYYSQSKKKLDTSGLISQYLNQSITYLCGTQDTFAGNTDCAANAQGAHHVSKMYHWTQEYLPNLPGSTSVIGQLPSNSQLRWVAKTGHEDWKIITSDPGVETLWLNQFFTNGTNANAPPSNGVGSASTPSINAGRATHFAVGSPALLLASLLIYASHTLL